MKRLMSALFAVTLLALLVYPAPVSAAPAAGPQPWVIPTFSIVSVVADQNVTIRTSNFPANDSFYVLMNRMGTRGVNGIRVATISSGAGGSFTQTFNIPAALRGLYQVAIRLESSTGSGYFAYNWFYNNTTGSGTGGGDDGTSGGTGYTGFPTFSITGVNRNTNVTVRTSNLPPNDRFRVRMGAMGTRGVGGYEVTTFDTGTGGSQNLTFNIPSQLAGSYQIAIRMESVSGSGYFAYNWFYNNTTGSGTGGGDDGTNGGTGYTGFPTFSISAVTRNQTVTISTRNLPSNDTFRVLMGPMGTRGIGGYEVTTFNTGTGGQQSLTFNIPGALAGSYQISIRIQSTSGTGYYAYNWFYNNSTQ